MVSIVSSNSSNSGMTCMHTVKEQINYVDKIVFLKETLKQLILDEKCCSELHSIAID